MPRLYRSVSQWFAVSKLRMAVLVLVVLASLVGFGVYEATAGKEHMDRRAGAVVGLVWGVMLAVVWFDEKRGLSSVHAWFGSLVLDGLFVFCIALLVAG